MKVLRGKEAEDYMDALIAKRSRVDINTLKAVKLATKKNQAVLTHGEGNCNSDHEEVFLQIMEGLQDINMEELKELFELSPEEIEVWDWSKEDLENAFNELEEETEIETKYPDNDLQKLLSRSTIITVVHDELDDFLNILETNSDKEILKYNNPMLRLFSFNFMDENNVIREHTIKLPTLVEGIKNGKIEKSFMDDFLI